MMMGKEDKKQSATDILLNSDKRVRKHDEFKLNTISKETGDDFIVKIRSLNDEEARDTKAHYGEEDVYMLYHALLEPNVKNPELRTKYKVETPIDLIREVFLPGEVYQIARRIDRISAFTNGVVEDIKKNSEKEATAT